MNELLDKVKVLMHENGYSIVDIKMVVDSFKEFYSYVSRNGLEKEFEKFLPTINNNVTRRIKEKKNVANVASVVEFNGTSIASLFIRDCIETKVQDVLSGFLKSSASYYNMACSNEKVDIVFLSEQLRRDGLSKDDYVDLTSASTIMSFSTELSLKTLYSLKNYKAIVNNIYSKVTSLSGDKDESIFTDRLKLIELVSGDWKSILLDKTTQDIMNEVRDSYTGDKPVNLPDDDKFGNVKVNGHTLVKIFANLPDEYKTMIKYQVATAFSRGDKKTLDDKVVGAIDYFLMITELDTTLENMDSTKQMVINSNNFDRMRYLIDLIGSEDLLFSMVYATSSYIIAKNEVDGISFSTLKNSDYRNKGLQYTEELDNLINNDSNKKNILDVIVSDKKMLNVAKYLSPKDLYVLVDKFNLDEVIWMKDSCNVEDSCSFKEMMYYCVFFKRYLNDYEFRYTGDKYKNINKLFYTIKNTNNLAMLGNQIAQWFAEINVYSLSQEEFDALSIFDNEFIYNSLSYKDRILYKKCTDKGIPFKIYYTSEVYTDVINTSVADSNLNIKNADYKIGGIVDSYFNKLLISNDVALNKLIEHKDVYDCLCGEFGGFDNIPNVLSNLCIEELKIIIMYCNDNNISIRLWLSQLYTTPCFFCKYMKIRETIDQNREKYLVKLNSEVYASTSSFSRGQKYLLEHNFNEFHQEISRIKNGSMVSRLTIDYEELLEKVYNGIFEEKTIFIPRKSNNEYIDYLVSNGFDHMTASYIEKKFSKEEFTSLLDQGNKLGISREVLPLLIYGRVTFDEVIEKNNFFVQEGCRLVDIPLYYYTRNDITVSSFRELFEIFNGVYQKNNIPRCLLFKDTTKVSYLLQRLKDEMINIYDFVNFFSSTYEICNDVDSYIFIYNTLKNIEIDSSMIIKNFDEMIYEYNKFKRYIDSDEQRALFFKACLYKSEPEINYIVELCKNNDITFSYELMYFDTEFLKNYFEDVSTCIYSYKMTKKELTRQEAYNFMDSYGYVRKTKTETNFYGKKVS